MRHLGAYTLGQMEQCSHSTRRRLFVRHFVDRALAVVSNPLTDHLAAHKMTRSLDGAIDAIPFPVPIGQPVDEFALGPAGHAIGVIFDEEAIDEFGFFRGHLFRRTEFSVTGTKHRREDADCLRTHTMQRRQFGFGVFRDVFHAGDANGVERIRRWSAYILGERCVHNGAHSLNDQSTIPQVDAYAASQR
jgi:hypothetical protein